MLLHIRGMVLQPMRFQLNQIKVMIGIIQKHCLLEPLLTAEAIRMSTALELLAFPRN